MPEPALQDATTSLLTPGSQLPSLTKAHLHRDQRPWPITEWSGYQMDWNHEVIHTRNPADLQQTESLDLSGFDAYNGYNAGHGAVPVFDMVSPRRLLATTATSRSTPARGPGSSTAAVATTTSPIPVGGLRQWPPTPGNSSR